MKPTKERLGKLQKWILYEALELKAKGKKIRRNYIYRNFFKIEGRPIPTGKEYYYLHLTGTNREKLEEYRSWSGGVNRHSPVLCKSLKRLEERGLIFPDLSLTENGRGIALKLASRLTDFKELEKEGSVG